MHFATLAANAGHKIVAVSDSKGAIYKEDGLDPVSVNTVKQKDRELKAAYCQGSVCEILDHKRLTNSELLELDVDILVPAALENQITVKNANNIKAKVVLELANGPTSSEADDILNSKGIKVIPDILANAGGVTVSYFEWVQNRAGFYWTEEEVFVKLQAIMERAAHQVLDAAVEFKCSGRTAAYIVALKRINEAVAATGTLRDFTARN